MDRIQEKERTFMNAFSNSDIATYGLSSKIDLPIFDKFLTTEIGVKYIGNMLKDIDVRLYLEYLKMLKDKIEFIKNYDVTKSVCMSEVSRGITRDVKISVPIIKNGIDLMATSHELGHGLKSFTKLNNERHLHSNTMYDETISILFGKICLDRYINDFGYDLYAQQFEIINIKNAVDCLSKIRPLLPEYSKKQDILDKTIAQEEQKEKKSNNEYYKCSPILYNVEHLRNELYTLISYPIGISLANVYDDFSNKQKEEYLGFISKYLLNIKHIDFDMILDYFDIPFDPNFYINNFNGYINKFENKNNKVLALGGKK